ncbi:MAG: hemerythrin domain-containing protein [Pseudomonadota bacterium]
MNIYERLKQDHDRHRKLADKIMHTTGDSEDRRALWEKFKVDCVAHANAEEQTLYASLIKDSDTQEQARHSVHEHEEVDELIEQLDQMEMSSGAWLQKFEKLKDELEHHMKEEEEEVFDQAKDVIASSEAKQMAEKFDQRKDQELDAA